MKIKQLIVAMSFTVASLAGSATAGEFGTAEEARTMLQRAIVAMKSNKDAALEAFNAGAVGFRDRDLYVACFLQGTTEGTLTAHGGVAKLVGTSAYKIIDKKGTNLGELLGADTGGKIESATYWFPRPGSTEPVEKKSFYATVADQNCLVGFYQ